MLQQEFLDILVCPKCHGRLEADEAGDGLVCEHCGLVYGISDGIVNMRVEEARSLEDRGE
ncbi:MAG: Trm112 family protein [Desulfatibacillaceae bacterium]